MNYKWIFPFALLILIVTACGASSNQTAESITPQATESEQAEAESTAEPSAEPETAEPESVFDVIPPAGAADEFSTDFSKHSILYSEVLSGGPPKDGIPSIDTPDFVSVEEADAWLEDVEPVIFVQVGEDARAYPIQILIWHEIVNDTVGDLPLTITFCPLCNTAIVFEREVNGEVLDFGTTGRLRNSNLIMYDRQTESWWQQATGEAVVGELLDTQLTFYPGSIIGWSEFAAAFPDGKVLSKDTGFDRPYGRNPYVGYDDINSSPFLYRGITPEEELSAMERVLAFESNGETVAYPYSLLEEVKVIHDAVGGEDVVVFWAKGTASALNTSSISGGRDVGAAVAFSPILGSERLGFSVQEDGLFKDDVTGSTWNILGQAVSGPKQGETLQTLTAFNHFWFDWVAFKPETRIFLESK